MGLGDSCTGRGSAGLPGLPYEGAGRAALAGVPDVGGGANGSCHGGPVQVPGLVRVRRGALRGVVLEPAEGGVCGARVERHLHSGWRLPSRDPKENGEKTGHKKFTKKNSKRTRVSFFCCN